MRKIIEAVVAVLLASAVCGCNLGNDPKLTVTVVVTGIPDKAESERIEKSLKEMVSGSVRYSQSIWTGDTLTMQLSPVIDVREFSRKIKFGKVTGLQENTVQVEFAKQQRI